MRVVLFSSCAAGAPILDALAEAGEPPELVVTGRVAPSRLAERASDLGIALQSLDDANRAAIRADLAIVAGCGQIWRAPLLDSFDLGAVNLHPSLLPKHRGRDPIFWTILAGDTSSGVTAHRMTAEVDAGPILAQREIPVPPHATSASLAEDLDRLAAALVPDVLTMLKERAPGHTPSDPGNCDRAVRAEDGAVDFNTEATAIDRRIRASIGAIHAHASAGAMKLILLEAEPVAARGSAPGVIESIDERAITVATAAGAIALRRFLFLDRTHDPASIAALLGMRAGGSLGNGRI